MKALKLGTVASLALVLAACPAEEAAPPAFEEPIGPPAVEPMPPTPAAETTSLDEVDASGVTGEVMVIPGQDRTEVTISVTGAPADESIGARIHSGTCESPGVEIAGLDAISTDAAGQGRSVTDVGHAPQLILDGNHIAAVYAPGAQPEQDMPIACATLPSTQQQI